MEQKFKVGDTVTIMAADEFKKKNINLSEGSFYYPSNKRKTIIINKYGNIRHSINCHYIYGKDSNNKTINAVEKTCLEYYEDKTLTKFKYPIGTKLRVISNKSAHSRPIGYIFTVKEHKDYLGIPVYFIENGSYNTWFYEEEVELYVEESSTTIGGSNSYIAGYRTGYSSSNNTVTVISSLNKSEPINLTTKLKNLFKRKELPKIELPEIRNRSIIQLNTGL